MKYAGEVTINKSEKLQEGYILYSPYAGEGFVIIDRNGRILHEWQVGGPVKLAELLSEGHLLYARMRDGVFEVDWNNKPVWEYRCRQHHDFCREENGNILILHHELTFNARVWHGAIDKNDVITEVDRQGNILWQWHADQHVDEFARLVGLEFPRKQEDWAHSNTVEVLPDTPLGRVDPRFQAGNVLFSCRNLDTISVIERPSGRIVWAWGPGELDGQHMPTMLPDGNIILFDNGTRRGYSRVLKIEPPSKKILWEYRLPDYAFARAMSGQDPLPNGNILICAGNPGIIMEVTADGEIVWEFRNKLRGRRESYATSLYRASFCPPERVEPFL